MKASKNAIAGCIYGLGIADALGNASRGKTQKAIMDLKKNHSWPEQYAPVHPDGLGHGSDNSILALILATSFQKHHTIKPEYVVEDMKNWILHNLESTGTTTSFVFRRISKGYKWEKATAEFYSFHPDIVTNGALARNGVIAAIAHEAPLEAQILYTMLQGMTTHYNLQSLIPAAIQTWFLYYALRGKIPDIHNTVENSLQVIHKLFEQVEQHTGDGPLKRLLKTQSGWRLHLKRAADFLLNGFDSFNPYSLPENSSESNALLTLLIALWSLKYDDFSAAINRVVSIGLAADSFGAVAGTLNGAIAGKSGLPPHLIEKLAFRKQFDHLLQRIVATE